jgi:predicted dithiol-disulfide oxidoreductase (DUF899 family)
MTEHADGRMKGHQVVSRGEWLAARTAFLEKEKEFTRLRDDLGRQRRDLPWVKVDEPYVFDGPDGKETLAQLFGKRSQLVVYHFMFGPADDQGCPHCSFWADHFDGVGLHLGHRDVTMVAISRAPLARIQAFKEPMGWRFKWLSSSQNDFNHDYQASFTAKEIESGTAFYNYRRTNPGRADREGLSVFYKDERGDVFHTYSTYERGIDMLNGTYHVLDLVPMGRSEDPRDPQSWVRHHDRYED